MDSPLTNEEVRHLRERFRDGDSLSTLSDVFDVHVNTVYRLVCGDFRLDAGGPIHKKRSYVKISVEEATELHRLKKTGMTYREIAKMKKLPYARVVGAVRKYRNKLA